MFDPTTFTGFHTWLSLIAIATGVVVVAGLLRSQVLPGWTALFLATAFLTSATGFGFAFEKILPSHVVGAIALVVLVVGLYALYGARLAGRWRPTYAVMAVISLYLLVFVAVAQAFQKIPALAATGGFPVAEGVVLVVFIALGVMVARRRSPLLAV